MSAIAVHELDRWLKQRPGDFALFDIREAGEAEREHIPGATALPRRLIEFRIDGLISARDTPIVVYDGDDGRAPLAAATLQAAGYRDVRWLAGGLPAWLADGRPIATGFNVPSKVFGECVLEEDGVTSIAPSDLAAAQAREPVTLWDVRTPAEYGRATIPGSCSAPSFEMIAHAAAGASGRRIVVHCAGRTRSIIAARTLQLLGVENVTALENGTMGWRLAGLELERGATRTLGAPTAADIANIRVRAQNLAAAAGVSDWTSAALSDTLDRRQESAIAVIDVRAADAFAQAHVPHALFAPGGQLVQCTDDFIAVRHAPVVLVDDGDARAFVAAYWLARMGLPMVGVLQGGMPAWREAGKPVAFGRRTATPPELVAAQRSALQIMPDQLRQSKSDSLIIDVGVSRDYAAGHLPGAIWIPRGWLELHIDRHARPDRRIVVTASDPRQSLLATATLHARGYSNAVALGGGNAAWASAGGELARGLGAEAPFLPDLVDPPYAKGIAEMRRYLEWEIALSHGGTATQAS
jgi:rhodanese-related sulfurtransferase